MTDTGAGHIRVEGLRELQRELRKVSADLPKELGAANQKVAQLVVDRARARASSLGRGFARAAESMTAARQQRVAAIRLGGARVPDAMGWEFGAGHNRPRRTARGTVLGWNQFPAWRGSGEGAGYFLWPTVRAERADIVELYGDLIDELAAKAFPD